MSVSPAQNFSKPPPVPDCPTVIFTSGFSVWNCSAAACANGKTVLEPSMAMSPETPPPLTAAAAIVVVIVTARGDAEGQHGEYGKNEPLLGSQLRLLVGCDPEPVSHLRRVCNRVVAGL